jgi:hypothetical protein
VLENILPNRLSNAILVQAVHRIGITQNIREHLYEQGVGAGTAALLEVGNCIPGSNSSSTFAVGRQGHGVRRHHAQNMGPQTCLSNCLLEVIVSAVR